LIAEAISIIDNIEMNDDFNKPKKAAQGKYQSPQLKQRVENEIQKLKGAGTTVQRRNSNYARQKSTHIQFLKRAFMESVDDNGIPLFKDAVLPDGTGVAFLCEKKIKGGLGNYRVGHHIIVRPFFIKKDEYFYYETAKEASKAFSDLTNPDLDARARDRSLTQIEDFKDAAAKVLAANVQILKDDRSAKPRIPRRLAFFLALDEVYFEGHGEYKGNGAEMADKGYRAKSIRRYLLRLIGNSDVPDKVAAADFYWKDLVTKVIDSFNGYSEGYARNICYRLKSICSICSGMPALFPEFRGLDEEMTKQIEGKIEVKTKNKELRRKKRHEYIPIKLLPKLFDLAIQEGDSLYSYIVLGLSTCLRPTELKRLVARSRFYYLEGTLNYKGIGIPDDDDLLVIKTMDHVDVRSLPNPRLSIISRIILKYHSPLLNPNDFFDLKRGVCRKDKDLSPYYERCLRTTGVTNLVLCENAADPMHRASLHTAKERCGHINVLEVSKDYAKHLPPGHEHPETYFQLNRLAKDKFDIGRGSSLWDLWLLRDYIDRQIKEGMPAARKEEIWEQIIKTAIEYQREIFGESDRSKFDKIY
jgi:hypothetical protein